MEFKVLSVARRGFDPVGVLPHSQPGIFGVAFTMPKDHNDERLAEAICELSCAIREWREQNQYNNKAILHRMEEKLDKIMATQADLAADLRAVRVQQEKTATEIASVQAGVDALNVKIVELEAIIAAGVTPTQELVDAVAAVKAQAEIVDALIPDLPTA